MEHGSESPILTMFQEFLSDTNYANLHEDKGYSLDNIQKATQTARNWVSNIQPRCQALRRMHDLSDDQIQIVDSIERYSQSIDYHLVDDAKIFIETHSSAIMEIINGTSDDHSYDKSAAEA